MQEMRRLIDKYPDGFEGYGERANKPLAVIAWLASEHPLT